jgi:hypothetical protein
LVCCWREEECVEKVFFINRAGAKCFLVGLRRGPWIGCGYDTVLTEELPVALQFFTQAHFSLGRVAPVWNLVMEDSLTGARVMDELVAVRCLVAHMTRFGLPLAISSPRQSRV